jgi:dTDP-4-dehydrorhamnose 3,5-epimerase
LDIIDIPSPFLTKLLKMDQSTGNVMHALKASSDGYVGFGEAYFSSVNFQKVKGWKLHQKMTLNLVVPHGDIRFIIHDGEQHKRRTYIEPLIDVVLGDSNYCRLTVPPGYWVAFQGVGTSINILMNVANIEHDPNESVNKSLEFFDVRGCENFA